MGGNLYKINRVKNVVILVDKYYTEYCRKNKIKLEEINLSTANYIEKYVDSS